MKRALAAMDRRPWMLALLASVGATLLVLGVLPQAAPPELLDQLVKQGDARLDLWLGAFFVAALIIFRVLLRHRPLPEEQLDEPAPASRPPEARREEPSRNGGYLR